MPLSIHINMNGNCREAVHLYAKVFGQPAPHITTYGEAGTSYDENVQVSQRGQSLVIYTSLNIAGTAVEFSDMPDNFAFVAGNNLHLRLSLPIPEAARVFEQLAEDGQVFVPFGEVPAIGHYGMLVDRFGLSWMLYGV